MNNILIFDKVVHNKIWGHEEWNVSAHNNGETKVISGQYQGKSLRTLFSENCELFGNVEAEQFPLLVKIIEAKDHLSVQVHPDDEYGQKYEDSLGKTECWYVLDCEDDADIVVGHNLQSKDELRQLIANNQLESKLNIFKINKGDFFFIPAGTIHAIRGGTKILEVQQSSDVTYRLYDYGRLENGEPRELHIDKSIDVIDFEPYQNVKINVETTSYGKITTYVDSEFFTVQKLECDTNMEYNHNYDYIVGVALSDNVQVNDHVIERNQGFIIPAKNTMSVSAGSEIFISYVK